MRSILIIGIGAGDPGYVTAQAVAALNRVDVFFLFDKGEAKDELIALRRAVCERFIEGRNYRFASAGSPRWSSQGPDYRAAVDGLNEDKRALMERMIREELGEGGCGGILVWGDPSLYDSTIRIVEEIAASGEGVDYEVIPGISAIQALVARHRVTLNTIGGAVTITTGRRLAQALPESDTIAVMLDARFAARAYRDEPLDIYWGAYLGTPDEMLVAGPLADVADRIDEVREHARDEKGWIMDTYLLRRRNV